MTTFGPCKSSGLSWLALSATLFVAAWPCGAKDVVVHAGTLLDGISDGPRHQVSITLRDDRILSVDSGFLAPPGADIIDLSTATVMPGFIDCHVHISALLPTRTNATEYWLTHTDIDRALDAAVFVREMLQQGFTVAVRNANPLDDPAQWGRVTFVMKGGIVYRRDGAPTTAQVN
jgi:adenine deaminase